MDVGGRIEQLWRHPLKSAAGERTSALLVSADGVVGDRAWGVRDVASGAVLSAKREPRLLLMSARAVGEGVELVLPSGRAVTGDEADATLSAWLDRDVRLELAASEPQRRGGFVDEAHLHLVAAGELRDWDVRRFRPNVVVHGLPDLDGLVGERLRLGTVVVDVYKRTKRCAMPTLAQCNGIGKDVGVLRALARERKLRLGVYASVVTPGRLRTGDPITVA